MVTPPAAGDFSVNLGLLRLHLICLYLHNKAWLAREIEIPSLGNCVKKPLERRRNPGARETEAGGWIH